MSPTGHNGQGNKSGNQGGGGGAGSSRRKQRRRSATRGGRSVDLWRPVPQLPDPEPIVPATDPGILLRSLGTPPLQGQGAQAEHAFELVLRRSSALAAALASTAGLLAQPGQDTDGAR